jgi:2-oxoglutarate/2-oxoacid ferredoxin oxidoreductase subunit beta
MQEAFKKNGFSFIEIISPCPTLYQRRNKMGDGLAAMQYYKQVSKVKNGCPTGEVGLTKAGEIIVGKFVDRDRPDYMELMRHQMQEALGSRYVESHDKEGEECGCQG